MTQASKLFELAQLAEASYAILSTNMTASALISQLRNTSDGMKFSATQATTFATNWRVVHHQPDTNSGYSARVGRISLRNPPNEKNVSTREQ